MTIGRIPVPLADVRHIGIMESDEADRVTRFLAKPKTADPPFTVLGYDLEYDRRRGFAVTENGVVVVPKGELPESFHAPNPLPN